MGSKKPLLKSLLPDPNAFNTFVGGIGPYVTKAQFASYLRLYPENTAFPIGLIYNWTVEGENIKCFIVREHAIAPGMHAQALHKGTYYRAYSNGCKVLETTAFVNCFTGGADIEIDSCIEMKGRIFPYGSPSFFIFKNVVTIGSDCFWDIYESIGAGGLRRVIYMPNLVNVGVTPLLEQVFTLSRIGASTKIYVPPALATSNAGAEEGDIAFARSQGAIIRYITDFTKPEPCDNLAVVTNYIDGASFSFTIPFAVNGIDYIELWIDGVYDRVLTGNTFSVFSLDFGTTHTVQVKIVDTFYNLRYSNLLYFTVSGVTGIVATTNALAHYPLNGGSADTYEINHGSVGTGISFVPAYVGQGQSGIPYDYSTFIDLNSKTILGGRSQFTFSCWIKSTQITSTTQIIGSWITPLTSWLLQCSASSIQFYTFTTAQAGGTFITMDRTAVYRYFHIVCQYDGTTMRMWYNAVPSPITMAQTGALRLGTVNERIGGANAQNSIITDEVFITSEILNTQQVEALYYKGRRGLAINTNIKETTAFPSAVTDLAVSLNYGYTCTFSWSAPTSSESIMRYEILVNDVVQGTFTQTTFQSTLRMFTQDVAFSIKIRTTNIWGNTSTSAPLIYTNTYHFVNTTTISVIQTWLEAVRISLPDPGGYTIVTYSIESGGSITTIPFSSSVVSIFGLSNGVPTNIGITSYDIYGNTSDVKTISVTANGLNSGYAERMGTYLKLNDNIKDTTGKIPTRSSAITYEAGKVGNAGKTDNTGVVLLEKPFLNGREEWSISFMYKTPLSAVNYFFGNLTYGAGYLNFRINSGTIYVSVATSAGSTSTNLYTLTDTNWHHIVMTYDFTRVRLFVDGIYRSATIAISGAMVPYIGRHEFLFGMSPITSSFCTIDEFIFWDYALPQNVITDIYTKQFINTLPLDVSYYYNAAGNFPTAISTLAIQSVYTNGVFLTHTHPTETFEVEYYEIWVGGVFYANTPTGGKGIIVRDLTNGVNYDIKVKAVDVCGNVGPFSNTINQTINGTKTIPHTSLITSFTFQDTAQPVYGNIVSTAYSLTYVDSLLGRGVKFTGAGSYIDLKTSLLLGGRTAFTIYAVFKHDGSTTSSVLCANWGGTYNQYQINFLSNNVYCYIVNVSSSVGGLIAALPSPTAWHTIAMVFNGTTCTVYLDGSQLGSPFAIVTTLTTEVSGNDTIGKTFNQNSLQTIDELTYYAEALSAGQIAALNANTVALNYTL